MSEYSADMKDIKAERRAWRIYSHTWPNGRPYWTVENRRYIGTMHPAGKKGGISKFHNRQYAERELERIKSLYDVGGNA